MSRVTCPKCNSTKVKKKGFSAAGTPRRQCKVCKHSWSKHHNQYKSYSKKAIFRQWLLGTSLRDLAKAHRLSKSHVQRLLVEQLGQAVEWGKAITNCRYAALDGKFLFGRRYTVLTLYNTQTNKPVASKVMKSENKRDITAFLVELKAQGFNPIAMTTDGKGTIAKCCKDVFPGIITQRCLFHIIAQVDAWVRRPPRSDIGWQLHELVSCLMAVDTKTKQAAFWRQYDEIKQTNRLEIQRLKQHPANRMEHDIIKCFSLLDNAKADMFHHLDNRMIASTTSGLEGFNKQIQRIRGFDHNGLTKEHLEAFIGHYVRLKGAVGAGVGVGISVGVAAYTDTDLSTGTSLGTFSRDTK